MIQSDITKELLNFKLYGKLKDSREDIILKHFNEICSDFTTPFQLIFDLRKFKLADDETRWFFQQDIRLFLKKKGRRLIVGIDY